MFLRRGADINMQDNRGQTPLLIVMMATPRRVDVAKILIERGALLDVRCHDGHMPGWTRYSNHSLTQQWTHSALKYAAGV